MKTIQKISFVVFALMLATKSFSQTNLETVFSNSYKSETAGKYSDAIKAVKEVYDEKSYEINLRLAYLNYESGLFTESTA